MRRVSYLVAGRIASFETTLEGFFSLFLARLSYKTAGIALLISGFLFFQILFPSFSFAFSENVEVEHLTAPFNSVTKTLFTEKAQTINQTLKYSKKYIIDPSLPSGENKIVTPGKNGRKTFVTKITYHNGAEFGREYTLLSEVMPTEEVIAISPLNGTETIETPLGKLTYSRRLNVWATAYDSTCRGCNEVTAIGLQAGFGVIAVDPSVIPLRSKVYIPGYGIAIAGDTGGKIKGNKIDLGFDNVVLSGWAAQYTDIYILE